MRTYQGDFTIQSERAKVWAFVIDPNQMGPCIPDLLELDVHTDTEFRTLVRVGVGPIRGKFDLTSTLSVVETGRQTTLIIKGGGMGSGVDMQAEMTLDDAEPGTKLSWQCDVKVSGPIASIGGRLIDNEARKITEKVFANLRAALEADAAESSHSEVASSGE
ncbi:CoxG family protein [Alicyclobacillus sp. ALC3]|uniref:CoxG family protein n=1 Tax=Alicyclobacillus sp. ALC3 TaxID=2796143 RepID=UPI00237883E6|nr:carbon monoxide dehydrogenase subunit G [Alicyclobacillus sp. ALC3]WDL96273.1 carbon monoxide dehydrogenase subunit G [Alicyclobacillus sp. ALC3]